MKLAAIVLLFALVGKMSASPAPYRFAYYRAAPTQQVEAEEDDASDETEISQEDFSQDALASDIQDDDEDSEEQDSPPQFHKLFPLPQRNSPGHNFPLAVMMSEVSAQGWNVPKAPIKQKQRQQARFELARDDDEDDEDSDEDEEDEEEEDDVPDWNALFPNLENEANAGPPQGVVDTSGQPEGAVQAYRSGMGGSRVVYIPARHLRRARPVPSGGSISRQYVMRNPMPPRAQVMYGSPMSYNRRQPVVQSRPQYVLASSGMQRRPQYVYSSSAMQRRPQQAVYYMPVRRNSYSPYVNRPYVPRYRYY